MEPKLTKEEIEKLNAAKQKKLANQDVIKK
jgi:hypothetical protein